jgi:beta-galactosidase/beta-glucuronidase
VFDRRILVPFAPQSDLSGIGERVPGDVLWYRRRFDAPAAERLLLHFGAVDFRATVWVNGEEVARHEGGHTPFSADLTEVARPADNELVVRAEDPLEDLSLPRGKQYWKERSEGIFYTPTSGIWQTVWLEPLPARHLDLVDVHPVLEAGLVGFHVEGAGEIEVVASLKGAVAGRWVGAPTAVGGMELSPVAAWSPAEPNLYDLTVRLLDGGRELDRVDTQFGLRDFWTVGGQVLLNGEPFVQRLVLDQGYFPGGLLTAPSDEALRRDIELAQAFGFNGARKHQKLEDPRWLYWADRLGFLVWLEMPNAHAAGPEAERLTRLEWAEAVRRDHRHPCVVALVPMNESFGLRDVGDEERARVVDGLWEETKRMRVLQPVVSNDGWEHARTDLLTLHDYDGPEKLAERYRSIESTLEPSARPHPPYLPGYSHRGEPVIVSEFGGLVVDDSEAWGYGRVKDAEELAAVYRAEVEALMAPGPVEGFCYTQLTDVEQERNGLLTFDRRPKVDPRVIREATLTPKRR